VSSLKFDAVARQNRALVAENATLKLRIVELEKQLRGDVDVLLCKCGGRDCDETTAKHDVEDYFWTDEKRIETLRAIVIKQHRERAELKIEKDLLRAETATQHRTIAELEHREHIVLVQQEIELSQAKQRIIELELTCSEHLPAPEPRSDNKEKP
jgi:hypothetical protein